MVTIQNEDRHRSIKNKVLSCFKSFLLRRNIARRVKEIGGRLDVIANEKSKFKLNNQGSEIEDPQREMTTSVINVSEICGRGPDKDVIMSKLTSEGSSSNRQGLTKVLMVIAIVGMGGLGKTTLAQIVYNDEQVGNHFEKRIWVRVSDPFDKVRLARVIIKGIGGQVPGVTEWNDELHGSLCKSVKDKLFLIVLDDVWTDDPFEWEVLKFSLELGGPGSRVLVTTRNERVALMMNALYIHHMGPLPEADSWSLFRHIAFLGRSEEEKHTFEEIGKGIVQKCNGVPLSIKTLGGLMCYKITVKDWQDVLDCDIWEEQKVEDKVLPALLLSYYALPLNLKRCFMYCAVLLKDQKLNKNKLVKLWMAHGFLNSEGKKELEKIGEEYFDDLVMRSFFRDIETDAENTVCCKVHNLVHDMAQFLTKNGILLAENQITVFDRNKIQHLKASNMNDIDLALIAICKAKKLHSLRLYHYSSVVTIPAKLFRRLKYLRTLDMNGTKLEELPSEIENLIHLRYLNLSDTCLKELPKSISNLCNLQTLMLNWCDDLYKLPEGIGKMISLRHLEIEYTDGLSNMPQGIGKLSNLRTLSKFILSDMGEQCKLGELKDLDLLQGKLEILNLGSVTNVDEAYEANLGSKKQLTYVTLNFCSHELEDVREGKVERMENVLEGLQIHPSVETLIIRSYMGLSFPSWITRDPTTLLKLRILKLINCLNCLHLPPLGGLAYLEELDINRMNDVKRIERDFYGVDGSVKISFSMLKRLQISDMRSLEEWDLIVENRILCLSYRS